MARKKRKGTHQPRRPAAVPSKRPEQVERIGSRHRGTMPRWLAIAIIAVAVAVAGAIVVAAYIRGDLVSLFPKGEAASTTVAPPPAMAKYVGGDAMQILRAGARGQGHPVLQG